MFCSVLFLGCQTDPSLEGINFKQEMRDFVIGISEYSKAINGSFLIIPQNGIEIVTDEGDLSDSLNQSYLDAIDAHGQEDLLYGYNADDRETPQGDTVYLQDFLNISKNSGNVILVTDYCSTISNVDDSYTRNETGGYISFAADHRELDNIPGYPTVIHNENVNNIVSIAQVENFLHLINPDQFVTKSAFISAVQATNYDLLIMDLFFHDDTEFAALEIAQLRQKANGGIRLVVCYMSIGEAENYRYYWQDEWVATKPDWLEAENPQWHGNYKVRYWDTDWQDIILGSDASFTKKILDASFDGVYLDIIEAFEFFE